MAETLNSGEADINKLLTSESENDAFTKAVAVGFRESFGSTGRAFNIDLVKYLAATLDSCNYVADTMSSVRRFPDKKKLMRFVVDGIAVDGPVLEFGVWKGYSLNFISRLLPKRKIYGFDSFEGLPEPWFGGGGDGKAMFDVEGALPTVPSNVEFVVGWFDRTLPSFVEKSDFPTISLLHVDCDLYSSTQTIFANLHSKIVAGTVIVFDEYFNYPGWRKHEFQAFQEFIRYKNLRYQYIGFVPSGSQVAVRIVG